MPTNEELKEIFSAGYMAWWHSEESRTPQSGLRRDNLAGYRALFEAGRREGAETFIRDEIRDAPDISVISVGYLRERLAAIRAIPTETGEPA